MFTAQHFQFQHIYFLLSQVTLATEAAASLHFLKIFPLTIRRVTVQKTHGLYIVLWSRFGMCAVQQKTQKKCRT